MRLPIPNEKEVTKFAELYEKRVGVKLSGEEATDAAIRLAQLFVLLNFDVLDDGH